MRRASCFCTFASQMRHDGRSEARQAVRMTDLQKLQRECRVFLARVLMVHGWHAPDVLRRMADALEWLAEQERAERERH